MESNEENKLFTFSDVLNALGATQQQMYYFNRDIESYMSRALMDDSEKQTLEKEKNSNRSIWRFLLGKVESQPAHQSENTKQKRIEWLNNSIAYMRYDFLKLDALTKAFLGKKFNFTLFDFDSKIDIDLLEFFADLKLNKNAVSSFANNQMVQSYLNANRLPEEEYLHAENPFYQEGKFMINLIRARLDITKALRDNGHLMNPRTMLLGAVTSAYITPAIRELDSIIEALFAKNPGAAFTLESLVTEHDYHESDFVEKYVHEAIAAKPAS